MKKINKKNEGITFFFNGKKDDQIQKNIAKTLHTSTANSKNLQHRDICSKKTADVNKDAIKAALQQIKGCQDESKKRALITVLLKKEFVTSKLLNNLFRQARKFSPSRSNLLLITKIFQHKKADVQVFFKFYNEAIKKEYRETRHLMLSQLFLIDKIPSICKKLMPFDWDLPKTRFFFEMLKAFNFNKKNVSYLKNIMSGSVRRYQELSMQSKNSLLVQKELEWHKKLQQLANQQLKDLSK